MTYVPNKVFTTSHVIAADVADDATFTIAYPTSPSTTTQLDYNAGQYKEGTGKFVVNGSTVWNEADPGIEVTTFGASTITLTNRTGATLAAGDAVLVGLSVWATQPEIYCFPVYAMAGVSAADVVTDMRPGVDGYITFVEWVQGVPVTTAAKLATLNLEIGTTDLTGGTVALTSAACTPLGKVIAGSRITANNRVTKASKVSIEAASVTAFVEGAGTIKIHIQKDVL